MSMERRVGRGTRSGPPSRLRYLTPGGLVLVLVVGLALAAGSGGGRASGTVGHAGRAAATRSLATGATRTYTVRPGDTLSTIAQDHHTTVLQLERANRGIDTDIQAGQRIRVAR